MSKSKMRRTISRWANPGDQDAHHLRQEYARSGKTGTTSIADSPDRERVKLRGSLRTVTLRPRAGVPALEAELSDGTGVILVVWLGRRRIAGIDPALHLDGPAGLDPGDPAPAQPDHGDHAGTVVELGLQGRYAGPRAQRDGAQRPPQADHLAVGRLGDLDAVLTRVGLSEVARLLVRGVGPTADVAPQPALAHGAVTAPRGAPAAAW